MDEYREIFAKKLEQYLSEREMTYSDLAERLGVNKSVVSSWKTGARYPRMNTMQRIAEILGCELSDLIRPKDVIPIYPAILYKNIPFVPGNVSAGRLMEIESTTELPICPVPTLLLDPQYRNSDNLMLLEINGDSMDRVIPDGSRVLIKYDIPRENLHDGDIVVVECDGEYTCKRYHDDKANRRIILTPDSTNPDFMPIIINYDENPYIIGKVVMYIAKV